MLLQHNINTKKAVLSKQLQDLNLFPVTSWLMLWWSTRTMDDLGITQVVLLFTKSLGVKLLPTSKDFCTTIFTWATAL